jgi:hypothetical protein
MKSVGVLELSIVLVVIGVASLKLRNVKMKNSSKEYPKFKSQF